MIELLGRLGRRGIAFCERLGRGHLFLLQVLAGVPSLLLRPRLIVQQVYSVGVTAAPSPARELGPAVAALLSGGRARSARSAETGLMMATAIISMPESC